MINNHVTNAMEMSLAMIEAVEDERHLVDATDMMTALGMIVVGVISSSQTCEFHKLQQFDDWTAELREIIEAHTRPKS